VYLSKLQAEFNETYTGKNGQYDNKQT